MFIIILFGIHPMQNTIVTLC